MKFLRLLILLECLAGVSAAQQARIIPWQPSQSDSASRASVYHPEPILLVHGINDNDSDCWSNPVIPALSACFTAYDLPQSADPLIGYQTGQGLLAEQKNYVHTFNYGDNMDSPVTNHNQQSFDHIQWNAWANDRDNLNFTDIYTGITTNAPHDQRVTLDERINGRTGGSIVGIRQAYQSNPNDPSTAPDIVLIAHSMGGLLSHYYMLKNASDTGVRRLVTLATPHLGSPLANWIWNFSVVSRASHVFRTSAMAVGLQNVHQVTHHDPAGFSLYTDQGAVEDLMASYLPGISARLSFTNAFLTFLYSQQAPKVEYVFNAYHHPGWTGYQAYRVAGTPVWTQLDYGDGMVPVWSAAGKRSHTDSSVWNGPSATDDIDPVIFGIWDQNDHTDASTNLPAIWRSIDGVPYQWPGSSTNNWPAQAAMYGENQSFSKYFSSPSVNSIAYTDEPGINNFVVLFQGATGNPLVIPATSTWDLVGGQLQKVHTNATDCVNHQIVGDSSGALSALATVGVKNHSQNPVGGSGANYWVVAGNEYLPASQDTIFLEAGAPVPVYSNATYDTGYSFTNVAFPSGCQYLGFGTPASCLVQFDSSGNLQYQYGLIPSPLNLNGVPAGSNLFFVAAQGQNQAGLLTPQAESVFNAPVDSTTLVAILTKINHGESLTNGCHNASTNTPWKATVSEWVNSNTGSITLGFFPVSATPNVYDAWTGAPYGSGNWFYTANNNTITINNPSSAPSQLVVSNQVYLGCEKMFTNSYGAYVPPLSSGTLAGVPVDETLVNTVRSSLEAILHKYKDQFIASTCSNWTKADIIKKATNSSQTDWTPIVGSLLLPQHFTELKAVTDLLTTENGSASSGCSCQCALSNGVTLLANVFSQTSGPSTGNTVIESNTVYIPNVAGARYWLMNSASCTKCSGGTAGTNVLYVDNAVVINGVQVVDLEGGTTIAPLEVTGNLVNGTNVFELTDHGGCYGCCDVGLYYCTYSSP